MLPDPPEPPTTLWDGTTPAGEYLLRLYAETYAEYQTAAGPHERVRLVERLFLLEVRLCEECVGLRGHPSHEPPSALLRPCPEE